MNVFQSSEDYLERILMLEQKLGKVRSIDIANDMNFSKASISIAMKKLKEKDLIHIDEKGLITLTSKGREIATKIYERHVVLTTMLIKLGVDEKIAREDACKIEHELSEDSFTAIKKHINQH